MLIRFLIFAVVLAVILGGASTFLVRRLASAFGLGPRRRRALGVTLGVAVAFGLGGRVLGWVPQRILEPLETTAFAVLLAAVFAAMILGVIDLAQLVASIPRRFSRRLASTPASHAAPPPSAAEPAIAAPTPIADPPPNAPLPGLPRRTFLAQATAGSAVLVGASGSLYGTLIGRHDYALVDVPARVPGLSRRLDGFTIVQLSDLHIGTFVGEPELRAAEDLVRRARPDLLILTGDLLDHDPRLGDTLARFVRRLGAYARHGVVAIPGNHDYYAGVDAVTAAVTGGGGTMLINDGRVIGDAGASFALLGVDDIYGPRTDPRAAGPDLDRAIATVPVDLPRVLLCHNPQLFPLLAPRVGLQLSGHTHGGQINFGVRPARLVLGHPFIAGAYHLGDTSLYVNRGFGTTGPPARIGSAPEVSRIILTG